MHPVGFEPTHLSIAVLETAPLDRSGTNALLSSLECVVVSRLGVVGVSCCVMLCHVVSCCVMLCPSKKSGKESEYAHHKTSTS